MNRRGFFASLFAPLIARCAPNLPTIPILRTGVWPFPRPKHELHAGIRGRRVCSLTFSADSPHLGLFGVGRPVVVNEKPFRVSRLEPSSDFQAVTVEMVEPGDFYDSCLPIYYGASPHVTGAFSEPLVLRTERMNALDLVCLDAPDGADPA